MQEIFKVNKVYSILFEIITKTKYLYHKEGTFVCALLVYTHRKFSS